MHSTKRKYKRRVQVYEPESNEKYYKVILGYDTDALYSCWPGKYIRKISTRAIFIYWLQGPNHCRLWCQYHKSEWGWGWKWCHLDYQEYQEKVRPEQEDQTIQQPAKVKLDPLKEWTNKISQVPESPGSTLSPPMASIWLHANCTRRWVKFGYIKCEKSGDQFVGGAVTGLPILKK